MPATIPWAKRFKFTTQVLFQPEYWPPHIFYFPIIVKLLWVAIKRRRIFFFANLNSKIPYGGLFGESKSEILSLFPERYLPKQIILPPKAELKTIDTQRIQTGLGFPLVAKPDVGERGEGIIILNNHYEFQQFFAQEKEGYILQEYINEPIELGVFVAREKADGRRFRVLSITGKEFMSLNGDGIHNLNQLLQKDISYFRQIKRLQAEGFDLASIPTAGEIITFPKIGNHRLGTKFLNFNHLLGPQIDEVFSTLLTDVEGIDYGRFDIKASSLNDLLIHGRFKIMEFNGVSSEAGVVYDPSLFWLKGLAIANAHINQLIKLSEQFEALGRKPASDGEILKVLGEYFSVEGKLWFKILTKYLPVSKGQKLQSPAPVFDKLPANF